MHRLQASPPVTEGSPYNESNTGHLWTFLPKWKCPLGLPDLLKSKSTITTTSSCRLLPPCLLLSTWLLTLLGLTQLFTHQNNREQSRQHQATSFPHCQSHHLSKQDSLQQPIIQLQLSWLITSYSQHYSVTRLSHHQRHHHGKSDSASNYSMTATPTLQTCNPLVLPPFHRNIE